MKFLRIPKLSKFKLRRTRQQPPQKLEARLRATSAAAADPYDEEEPQTKLTGALVVVAVLHVVAVGGIYAFNQIKASRRGGDIVPVAATKSVSPPPSSIVEPLPNNAPAKPGATQASSGTPVVPVSKQRVHNVKPGETLTSIAKAMDVSVVDLKAANDMSTDVIRQGQILNIPTVKSTPEAPIASHKATEGADAKASVKSYTIKSGDRLVFIAKRYGVTQEDLVAFNKIKDPTKLQIGQTIRIPVKKAN